VLRDSRDRRTDRLDTFKAVGVLETNDDPERFKERLGKLVKYLPAGSMEKKA